MSVCESVGEVHRSRGGWVRGVTVVSEVNFLWDFSFVGWSRDMCFRYVNNFYRIIPVKFTFQIGLVVRVR